MGVPKEPLAWLPLPRCAAGRTIERFADYLAAYDATA
jgi:hypothetical protein